MTVVFGRLEVRFMSARSECADRAVRRRTWVSPSTVSMVRSPLRGALSASQSVDVKPDSAEVVFLGEILGATGFSDSCVHGGVMCRWQVVHGEHWNLERGERGGATQASEPSAHGGELAAWSHPLQMSFSTTSVQVRRARSSLALHLFLICRW